MTMIITEYPIDRFPSPCLALWGGSAGVPCDRAASYLLTLAGGIVADIPTCVACRYTAIFQHYSFGEPMVRDTAVGNVVTARTAPPGRLWELTRFDEDGNAVLRRLSTDPLARYGPAIQIVSAELVAPVARDLSDIDALRELYQAAS